MITNYTHFGLIFTAQDVKNAQISRDQAPYAAAWAQFEAMQVSPELQNTPAGACVYDALRWRLLGDVEAGVRALGALVLLWEFVSTESTPYVNWLKTWLGTVQAYECLRDHPAYESNLHRRLYEAASQWAGVLTPQPSEESIPQNNAWLCAVRMAVGVALDDSALVESTVAEVRAIIDSIHPAGFIPRVINPKPTDPTNFLDSLQTIHGLTLATEIAAHAGIDLWGHQKRSVSLMTAAFYPLYYYYYPEKWKWGEGLTFEQSQGAIKSAAGYLEIVNRRRPNVHAVKMILAELRPVMDLTCGGALTLTHQPSRPQKRGWFGR